MIDIKQEVKNVFQPTLKLNHPISSTHYFKLSPSGKIHIVHKITSVALCNHAKFEHNGFTNLLEVDETQLCKNCVRFHNVFTGGIKDE